SPADRSRVRFRSAPTPVYPCTSPRAGFCRSVPRKESTPRPAQLVLPLLRDCWSRPERRPRALETTRPTRPASRHESPTRSTRHARTPARVRPCAGAGGVRLTRKGVTPMLSFLRRSPAGGLSVRPSRCRLALEPLEDRTVPYALSGYTWANPNVSVSFMPDGTLISSSYPSNLFAVYNAAYPQATWQREVARALQSWANVSNLNFHFVPDDGSPQGTAGLAQGDSRFGDIRIGGYNMGSGILGLG